MLAYLTVLSRCDARDEARPGSDGNARGVMAAGPVKSKEDEMRDFREQQKSDSPASLSAGSVRRVLPGRGGLPGVAAAAGLALLLSACGGGGAGAPNAGAALGAPASSILADAAVAPAPVAEQTAPDAGETPPPNPQARAPQTPKTLPVALPPVAETIPPRIRESQRPPTARNTVTAPSTLPFPSGSPVTDETVNMNTFGTWGHPDYQPGGSSADKNNGPNVVVRRRVGYSKRSLTLPISGGSGKYAYTSLYYGPAAIANLWLTYPADAGAGNLAVHIRTRRATPGGYGSLSHDAGKSEAIRVATGLSPGPGVLPGGVVMTPEYHEYWLTSIGHKGNVLSWLEAAGRLGPKHGFTIEDFFLTEAYLQAPGNAVQPAARGSETSATWTGQVIAFDSAASSILSRGTEIGGDARVTVNFGGSPTVDVSLTDLRSARAVSGAVGAAEPNGGLPPSRYPSQTWTGLALAGGGFSDSSGGRSIEGAFRNQGPSTGTSANTVGGIFAVPGTIKGGFVATLAPPSPF